MKRILLAAAIVAATSTAATAQYLPQQGGWNTSTFGGQSYSYGTGANQGWYGNHMQFGNQGYSNFNGPNGQQLHCNTQRFGAQVYTNCN